MFTPSQSCEGGEPVPADGTTRGLRPTLWRDAAVATQTPNSAQAGGGWKQVSWPPWRMRLEQLLLLVVVQFEPVARSFVRDVKVLDDNGR